AFVNIPLGRMRLVTGPVSWLTHAPLLARFPLTPSVSAALGGLASLATAATTGVFATNGTAQAALARVPQSAPRAAVARQAHNSPPQPVRVARKPVSRPAADQGAPARSSAPSATSAASPTTSPAPAAP